MTVSRLYKRAGRLLAGTCLALLCACSVACPVSPSASDVPTPDASAVTPGPDAPPMAITAPLPGTEPSLPPEPEVEPYDYALPAPESDEVGDDWFADAVFLGDSRTDGLRLYGGITEADFICYKGLMCREFDNKRCISDSGKKITPQAALTKKQYGKVFLMLGLNELGFATETFAEDYAALIDAVRAAQPEAVLYVQSIVPINDRKSREKNQPYYVTNEKITAFNAEITRLCEEKQVILVDTAAGLSDETGELPYEAATDGVHFTKAWYQNWYTYLKTHTVDPERLEAAS